MSRGFASGLAGNILQEGGRDAGAVLGCGRVTKIAAAELLRRGDGAVSWIWIALASVVSGGLGAMGLGGGGILLLVLVWAGWPQLAAQGINLLMILPVGLLGLYFHRKNGLTDREAARPLLWGGLPGVGLGVLLGGHLGEDALRTCFGVLILLLAVRELWLGIRAIRRDGWRLKAPADGEESA